MSRELKLLLASHCLEDCYSRLVDEDIDIDVLPSLSEKDLKEIGFNLGERKRLMKAVAEIGAPKETPEMPAERRNLTVAFCDLVGSTNLASVLDPEDLRSVITQYLDTAVATMRTYGGHLAYTQGDGLMIYFGYPQAREDDALQAIRAGLATIYAVQSLRSKAPGGLNVRIGVATGRVVVGDMVGDATAPKDFVVGETPNLAARLQSLASPGELLVADKTHDLAAGAFEFESRGMQQIKGFDRARAVFAVKSEMNTKSRFDARVVDGLRPIIGREDALNTLETMWAACAQGKGGMALIEGAAGIGKSRLIRSLFNTARAPSLEWQCAPHLSNRALHPITGELERAAGILRSDDAEVRHRKAKAIVSSDAGFDEDDLEALASLVGSRMEDAGQTDALALARRSRDMIVRRVFSTTQSGPAIAILEDAHWADPMTLELLDTLADRIAAERLLLLVTYRPGYSPSPAVLDAATHIQLNPLTQNQSKQLIADVTNGKGLPDVLAKRILEKADGVPLYVEEMTKAVLEVFSVPLVKFSDKLDQIAVPATLQDSLMARLDRMGPAKEIAQLGALIGREFTLPMVAAIAPDGADVQQALLQLEEAGILHRHGLSGPDFFVFNHALIQDTAYESMLRSRRQTLHRALALEMLGEHEAFGAQETETIAHHCELGGLTKEAITYWTRAGHEALARASNLSAVADLNSALRLLETQPEGPDRDNTELGLQMSLMPAAMSIYGWGAPEVEAAALRARDLAGQLNDGQALYGATWGVWTMHFLRGEMGACLDAARQADGMAQMVGVPMLLTTADHAMGYSHFWMGDFDSALSRYRAGMDRYDAQVETEIIANFQFSSSLATRIFGTTALWLLGHEDEAATARAEIVPFAESLNHKPSLAYGLGAFGQLLTLQQDWEQLVEVSERCYSLAEEEGYILWQRVADVQNAVARGALGDDPARCLTRLTEARKKFLVTGSRITDLIYFPAMGDLMIQTGQAESALELAQDGLKQAEARLEKAAYSELFRMHGRVNQALGDLDAAKKDFEKARKVAQAQGAVQLVRRVEADARTFDDLIVTKSD